MNNSNLNLDKQQRKTVLPCPVCGKSLRKEFFFRGRRDRLIFCPSCKTELKVNFRRKETFLVFIMAELGMAVLLYLISTLGASFLWIMPIGIILLGIFVELSRPKFIYFSCKDSKDSSLFTPDDMQRQSRIRKTQLFNMVTLSLTIAIIVASVVFAVVNSFPTVSWNMSIFILVGIFVIVFLISFTVQHRRQEQRDNNFFMGNDLNKGTNAQAKSQSNKRKSPRLIVWILIVFIVIIQIILIAMVYSG